MIDFSGLYRAHARDVHRFVLFLSGDPSCADDVVTETFVRLWHARERVDLVTVRAYLLTIARNLYLQQQRHARRLSPLETDLADGRPGPEERVAARGELSAVLAALQVLPEIDRAAVLMRAEQELPYAAIGAALGVSESAARVKVHRARLRLAEARRLAVAPAPPRKEAGR